MTPFCVPCEELRLPIDESAPSQARRFLTRTAAAMGLAGTLVDDACLMVSELVTNAVRYGRGAGELAVRLEPTDDDGLRVEVVNPGEPFEPSAYDGAAADQASGWGLQIVDSLAATWGVKGRRPTIVWFELRGA